MCAFITGIILIFAKAALKFDKFISLFYSEDEVLEKNAITHWTLSHWGEAVLMHVPAKTV